MDETYIILKGDTKTCFS